MVVVDEVVVVELVDVVVPGGCVVEVVVVTGGRVVVVGAGVGTVVLTSASAPGFAFGAGTLDGVTWRSDTVAWTRREPAEGAGVGEETRGAAPPRSAHGPAQCPR